MAISHAQTILNWQENLFGEDMPPEWMWPFNEELEKHFDEVEKRRKRKYGEDEEEESGPMVQNELSRHMREG